MTFGERLITLRKALKISQTELANVLKCKQPSIHEYEKNKTSPNVATIQNIASEYSVNLNWLLTGQGAMFLSETIQVSQKIDELERKLEAKIKQAIDQKFSDMSTIQEPVKEDDFWYLKIQGEIVCGDPMEFLQDDNNRKIPVSKSILPNPNDCDILRVNGDSMLPDLEHSDLVVIRRETNWLNCKNKIVAIRNQDGLTLKKLVYDERNKSALLIPSNKKYYPIMFDESCTLCGYLVFLMRYF